MGKITPCLWFDGRVEEAIDFYISVFGEASKGRVSHYGDNMPQPKGAVMTASFTVHGQEFMILNGGPHLKIGPAISFVILCDDQAEVDHYWDALSEGGQAQQCGWLTDRFGVSWQVVPKALPELTLRDPATSQRVMEAVMGMTKLDVAALERAATGA
jgi:predicted 3-demethylubiquinone-9 3-methyltransferase (glyoxalase superfamily)